MKCLLKDAQRPLRGRVVALLWQPIFRYNTRVKAVFIVIREF